MNKIAIVVQRYGLDLNGGAEVHARILAEHLSKRYEVDVLTTTRREFVEGEDEYYNEGEVNINGIKVTRFKILKGEDERPVRRYLRRHHRYTNRKITLTNFFYLPFLKLLYREKGNYNQIFSKWMESSDFRSEELIDFLRNNKDTYTAFIFFTYLFHPTYAGLQVVGYKSIFIPTAHDEPPFYFRGMNRVFSLPKFFMYNTVSEKELVERNYPQARNIKSDIAGVGFDKPVFDPKPVNVGCRYFVYIGRITKGKGCKELIDYFRKFKESYDGDLKLVMIGNNYMKEAQASDDVIFTGFISEEEKLSYLQNSEALIISSTQESLSMVTLEAMVMGRPVLVTNKCEVLRRHIEASEAGFTYDDQKEFSQQLERILNLSEIEKADLARKGISYVENNYRWSNIMAKFDRAISYIEDNQ